MYEQRKAIMKEVLDDIGLHSHEKGDAVVVEFDTGDIMAFEFDNIGIHAMNFIKTPFSIEGNTLSKVMRFVSLYNSQKKWPHLSVSEDGDAVVSQFVYTGEDHITKQMASFAFLSIYTFNKEEDGKSWKKQFMKVVLNSLEPENAIQEMYD